MKKKIIDKKIDEYYTRFINRLDQLVGDEKRILRKYIRKIEMIRAANPNFQRHNQRHNKKNTETIERH